MKRVVIYYSLEGHTEMAAKLLAEELGADLIKLELVKPFPHKGFKKYFWCGKSAVFREKPKLKSNIPDVSKYDLIIIGSPVWAGKCASPINSLINDIKSNKYNLDGKRLGMLITNGGGSIKGCLEQVKKAFPKCLFLKPLHFIEPKDEQKEMLLNQIRSWIEEEVNIER